MLSGQFLKTMHSAFKVSKPPSKTAVMTQYHQDQLKTDKYRRRQNMPPWQSMRNDLLLFALYRVYVECF